MNKLIYDTPDFLSNHSSRPLLKTSFLGTPNHTAIYKSTHFNQLYGETPWGYHYPFLDNLADIHLKLEYWHHLCRTSSLIAEVVKIPPFLSFSQPHSSIFDKLKHVGTTCALDLDSIDSDNLLLSFQKSVRYSIRKSLTSACYSKASLEDLESIYHLYNHHLDSLQASSRFYLPIATFKYLINAQASTFLIAKVEGQVEGFTCFLKDSFASHYHLSATTKIGRQLQLNYGLIYNSVLDAINQGVSLIHYGGGLTTSVADPLFKFKFKFANKKLDYYLGLLVFDHNAYDKYHDASSLRLLDLN